MRPWGVFSINDLIMADQSTQLLTSGSRMWHKAKVRIRYPCTIYERIRAAYYVLTGKAEAVIWPSNKEVHKICVGIDYDS